MRNRDPGITLLNAVQASIDEDVEVSAQSIAFSPEWKALEEHVAEIEQT
jgi:hypothetical protein